MAYLWPMALIPRYDESGNPLVGAKAYFFDAGTTTPMLVYTDPAFSIPHDHPVVANGRGAWPAVFIEEGKTYRLRVTDANDVTLDDVDGISVPTLEPPDFPESDTPVEQIFQTGDMKIAWRSSAPNGWVRCNGRTIGAAASGATERANADCEDLFVFLWNNASNLAVSGGRGGTADGDWAANKQMSLPDFRGRVPVGLDSFGNSAANRITDAQLGADSDTLGASGGAAGHTLTTGQLPEITPAGSVDITDPTHKHLMVANVNSNDSSLTNSKQMAASGFGGGDGATVISATNTAATVLLSAASSTGITASFSGTPFGSDEAHNNLQPSIVSPWFIKL